MPCFSYCYIDLMTEVPSVTTLKTPRFVQLHDAHSADAVRPPDISHSLARLPACVTCHAPEGLKPVPVGHEETDDLACRSCHKRPTAGQ